jgi:OOP family OmpA-OmpF porin
MRTALRFAALVLPPSLVIAPAPAEAADGGASLSASASPGSTSPRRDDHWQRFRPTSVALELGAYAGLASFSKQHNLQDLAQVSEPPGNGHQTLKLGPDLGLRVGFYLLSWLGAEGELGFIPTKTGATKDTATIWTYRLQAVAQYPAYRLVPFVLVGGGGMNLHSTRAGLGKDSDPDFHVGIGAKYALLEMLSLRLDLRDNLMQKNRLDPQVKDGELVQNFEFLLGASFTLGRTPARVPAPPRDSDGDGFVDAKDACPSQPGVAPNGCPKPVEPPRDSDEDGVPDTIDPCPRDKEDGQQPVPDDGCPNKDLDDDGFFNAIDKCPTEKGVAPDGCPIRDSDSDGVLDNADKCPDQPETKNGFQDADGCPDELPKEVAKFSGVIPGIQFEFAKATIRKVSNRVLDEAVKVLEQYPELRIEISGHTDNVGDAQVNLQLSQERAEAVKAYLVGKGIDAARIQTRGAGSNEPAADNATEQGRQQNRRIEFKLVQ